MHYSSDYAVMPENVRRILRDYIHQTPRQHALVHQGIHLDGKDQRRRYVIKSLLRAAGLDLESYRTRFGSDPFLDLPLLGGLERRGLAVRLNGAFRLTPEGMELSDAIGPSLYSERVRGRMESFSWR
jgi:oxygen-independent coproporphyrinogen-3 oxidase